jgi:hypothetical protein
LIITIAHLYRIFFVRGIPSGEILAPPLIGDALSVAQSSSVFHSFCGSLTNPAMGLLGCKQNKKKNKSDRRVVHCGPVRFTEKPG